MTTPDSAPDSVPSTPNPITTQGITTQGPGLSQAGVQAQRLGLKLRAAQESDLPFLFQIYATTRPEILALPWTDEEKIHFLFGQLNAQKFDYESRFPGSAHSVIERELSGDEGVLPLGRIWIAHNANEIRLLDIALAPQHCGQGVGTALLQDLIAIAIQKDLPLRHAVDAQNLSAKRLYERLGFQVTEDAGTHLFMTYQP